MIYVVGFFAVIAGLAGGASGLWLCQRRGWLSYGAIAKDGQETLALFVEGMRCLSGKKSAPCAKCGWVPGSGASNGDRARARSALRIIGKEVTNK